MVRPLKAAPAGLLLLALDLEKDQAAENKEYQSYRNDGFQFHSQFLLSQILTAVLFSGFFVLPALAHIGRNPQNSGSGGRYAH